MKHWIISGDNADLQYCYRVTATFVLLIVWFPKEYMRLVLFKNKTTLFCEVWSGT